MSIYRLVRSGGLMRLDLDENAKDLWKREQKFLEIIQDEDSSNKELSKEKQLVRNIRQKFEAVDSEEEAQYFASNDRIGLAFDALRDLGDHSSCINVVKKSGYFDAMPRSDGIKYSVGDIVKTKKGNHGVVVSWELTEDGLPEYDILLDTNESGKDYTLDYFAPQNWIELAETPKAIKNPSLLLFFDGFENGKYIPCKFLRERFPEDGCVDEDDQPQDVPTISQVSNADEETLISYLGCKNKTIVELVTVALETRWAAEGGENGKKVVDEALELFNSEKVDDASELLLKLVHEKPNYAHAWLNLALFELVKENDEKALAFFRQTISIKPLHIGALKGMATCATKLKDWQTANEAAMKIIKIQPDCKIAKKILAKVDEALYFLL